MSELDSNPIASEVTQSSLAPGEEENHSETAGEVREPQPTDLQPHEQSQDLIESQPDDEAQGPETIVESDEPPDAASGSGSVSGMAGNILEAMEEEQSSKLQPQMQLTKDEIAYGLSYFSHQHGYTNQFNVVTPDLFQKRMQPICELSLHGCEHLLRAPFTGSINGRAVGGQTRGDQGGAGALGKRTCLTPAQVSEIMSYRVGPSDDKDFALESFKMLGAASIKDTVPIEKVADLLISAYCDIETQLEEAKDFQSICEYLTDKNTQLERIKAKTEGREVKKVVSNVRTAPDPSRPKTPPRLRTPSGLSRKAVVDPRCQYAIPLREDILYVLRQCCIGEDSDKMDYISWREIFTTLLSMKFVDYREEITQMSH